MKPDKPRTWLNPQSSSFDQDIQALGGTIIHLQTSNQIFDPNSTTLLEPDPQKASLEATPTCEDRAVDKTEPAIPHCIQCGRLMNLDGDTWVCGTCCWTRDQNDHWSHDTLRLATRTLTAENQTNLNTPAEAYVVGFLAAWDKALELCRSLENQLGEHA